MHLNINFSSIKQVQIEACNFASLILTSPCGCTCLYVFVRVCTCLYVFVRVCTCLYVFNAFVRVCTCVFVSVSIVFRCVNVYVNAQHFSI